MTRAPGPRDTRAAADDVIPWVSSTRTTSLQGRSHPRAADGQILRGSVLLGGIADFGGHRVTRLVLVQKFHEHLTHSALYENVMIDQQVKQRFQSQVVAGVVYV